MNFYKTAKWESKRENVLRRDEYLCRECRRYGKSTPATTVHHIVCFRLIDICDEAWIYGDSEGCRKEREYALSRGKKVFK